MVLAQAASLAEGLKDFYAQKADDECGHDEYDEYKEGCWGGH